MATRSPSSLYQQDGTVDTNVYEAGSLPANQADEARGQPSRTLRLFVSSPAYAETERILIHGALAEINTAFKGALRIEASGPAIETANQTVLGGAPLTAADCDAVVAILRPRLPTDSPVSAEQASAEARGGGAGSVLSAMGGGKAGADLPDISIFRYATAADRAAGDANWENGKQAFRNWFTARGGKSLAFEDFTASDEFGTKLRGRLDGWLTRNGFTIPVEEPQPADSWETLAAEIAESIEAEVVSSPEDTVPEPVEDPTPIEAAKEHDDEPAVLEILEVGIIEPIAAENEPEPPAEIAEAVPQTEPDVAETPQVSAIEPEPIDEIVQPSPQLETPEPAIQVTAQPETTDALGVTSVEPEDEALSEEIPPLPVADTVAAELPVETVAPEAEAKPEEVLADAPLPKTRARGSAKTRAKARKAWRGRGPALDLDEAIKSGLAERQEKPKAEEEATPQSELFEEPVADAPEPKSESISEPEPQPTPEPAAEVESVEPEIPDEPEPPRADLSLPAEIAPQVVAAPAEEAIQNDSLYQHVAEAERITPIMLPKKAAVAPSRQRRSVLPLATAGIAAGLLIVVGLQWRSAAVVP